jgi:hypothetical protein
MLLPADADGGIGNDSGRDVAEKVAEIVRGRTS